MTKQVGLQPSSSRVSTSRARDDHTKQGQGVRSGSAARTPNAAVHAAYGNGVANAIVFTEPLVITATALPGSRTQTTKAATQPPVVDGGTIQFAPDTITARAPDPTPWSLLQPAQPTVKEGVIEFPPETIFARAPQGKPGVLEQPIALSKAGVLEFAPETLYGNAPGATRTTPLDTQQKEKQAQRTADEVQATEEQDEADRQGRKKESEAETGKDLQQPAAVAVTAAAEKEVTPSGAAAGEVSGLAEWRARVKGATAAAPTPTLGKAPAAGITVIHTTGRGNSARRKAVGGGLVDDAKKAVRKPPETPKQLPAPPPTPVPAADQLVTEASDKKLPKQTLPVLKTRPGGTVPTMDTELAADIGTSITVPAPEPTPTVAGDKKPLDSKQVKKLKDAKAKQPDASKKAKAGETMVLEDTAPPPTPGIEVGTRGQSKEKVAQVLAELLRSPEQEAAKIVTEARREAYPRAALQMEYPEFGKEKQDEVLTELKNQVESIRVIAGISVKELDAAINTRNETLKKIQGDAVTAIDKARDESKDETKTGGAEVADKIAGARQAVDEHTIQQLIAARGEADPEVIKLRRDKGLTDIARRAARQDVYYEKSGERRDKALDAAGVRMHNAYKNAAKHDRDEIYKELIKTATKGLKAKDAKAKEAAAKEATAQADQQARPFFEWTATQTLELKREFEALRSEAAAVVKRYRDGIKGALAKAKEMIREWAEAKIAAQESWWDNLIRRFREWVKDAQDDSAAWEEARNEGLRDSLVGDLNILDDVHAAARSGMNVRTFVEERGLDRAQMAIVQTYYGGDKDKPRDAIGAVAVGMRMRVRTARKPGVIEYLKSKVMALPDTDWPILGRIGYEERPPFNVVALASDLHEAMDQWGTDEDKIYQALANLTPLQARAIRARYITRYRISLDAHLADELSGAEQTRADALLAGNQTLADVATLYEAMHGGLTGAGTDEDAIMRVLRNKKPEEREAIVAEYKKRYGIDLNADLKSELDDGWSSHHDYDRATALMEGNTAKADAIAVDQTMHGGVTGAGTAEKELYAIFEQTRAEVEAEAASRGWTTKDVEKEIRRRNELIEAEYEKKYGDPNFKPGSGKSAMRKAFESELSDEELDLANALADNDVLKADAARLEIEKNSFITGDEAVNNVLESQYKRARREVERDVNVDLQFRAEVDALRDKPWKPEDWKREREGADKHIDEESKKRGKLYMSQLENTYDEKYSKFGKGGLQVLIAFGMSGTDRQKAYDLIEQGGYVEPEQELYYAVEGVGTDVDALKRVLKGKSPAEVKKIRDAWNNRYGHDPGFDERIKEEVSGRDLQDMEWALQGEPQTMEGKLQRAKERMDYEENAYGVFGTQEAELNDIKEQYAALQAEKAHLEKMQSLKGDKRPGESEEDYAARTEQYAYWEDSFNLQHSYFDRAVEDHRKAVDKLADMAATIAAIVATVIVVVVVTIATGGTAAALFAALASAKVAAAMAVAAAAATIVTKQLIKGSAYTSGEMLVDVAVGIVDTAASVLTAGVGGALLKTARAGAPVSRIAAMAAKTKAAAGLAKMAASKRVATRVFANALAEGMEGVASTLPSALVGNALKEENWAKGNPLTNILTGTLVETSIGAGLGGGLGGLGGLGKHADDLTDALPSSRKALADEFAETGDVLGKRGTPTERLAVWKGWQAENPGRPYRDFLQEFDAGLIAKEADESAVKAMQRELRGELLSGIPPSQRKQFADVPIHVMSDADFERFTRSATGQAVVIFEDGKPRVILREGADAKVLREEGIHLLQSKDPKFAKKFAELDESRLANWKNLDLDEQLGLYRTKLDIEIDAQKRLIKSLQQELAAAGSDAKLRLRLGEQVAVADLNLRNLSARLDEVDGITPGTRMKTAKGELDMPEYLDQPPRLFSKKAKEQAANLDAELDAPPAKIDVDTGPTAKPPLPALTKSHRAVLDALTDANIDTGEAAIALRKLREAARESRHAAVTYREVTDAASKMDPAKADAFLRAISDTAVLRPDAVKRLTGMFRAAARAEDPAGLLHRLQGILVSGPPGQGLPLEPLEALATQVARVSRTSPGAASDMLRAVESMLDRFSRRVPPGLPGELAPLLRAVGRADDAMTYLRDLGRLVDGLSHAETKMPKATLARIGESLNTMPPARMQGFVDAAATLVNERPRQVAQLNQLLETATKVDDPSAFLGKVGRLSDALAHAEHLLPQVGRKTLRLSGARASAYLDKLVDTLEHVTRRADVADGVDPLDVLVAASTRKADPIAFLDAAAALYRRRVSPAALRVLARKAEARKIDLEWLHSSNVDDWLVDFLGRNPRTSWRTFRAASQKGAEASTIQRARSKLRGLAGEFAPELPLTMGQLATNQRVIDVVPEVTIRGTVLDYLVLTDDGLLRGLEVKAWTSNYWDTIIYALNNRNNPVLKDAREVLEPLASVERLFRQLRAAADAAGEAPILALSDQFMKIMPAKARDDLLKFLMLNSPAGTRIAWLNDAEIRMIANELARQLGIP